MKPLPKKDSNPPRQTDPPKPYVRLKIYVSFSEETGGCLSCALLYWAKRVEFRRKNRRWLFWLGSGALFQEVR